MINYADKNISGGKGASLQKLTEFNFNVPPFEIVTSIDFKYWENNKELSEEAITRIENFSNLSKSKSFAVRSSATAEDGANNSYAGVLETFLYTEASDIIDKIIKCFNSFYSDRILQYEQMRDSGKQRGSMAVVVQEMIESDISGVAFSRSPDIDDSLVYIEAGIGLGEGVVSGLVDVDRFYVNRFQEIIKKDISNKQSKIAYCPKESIVKEFKIDEKEQSLSSSELNELTKVILDIEKHYGFACDVEWSFHNGILYILQVRPITQPHSELELYIDTNLSESYPGHTTPITGDYVNLAYSKVHYELAENIGFDKRKRDSMLPYLNTMTNYIDGHMYYRLESYYNILLSIPGGKQNLKNWHRMISGDDKEIGIKTTVEEPDTKDTIIYYKFLLNIIFKHTAIFTNFLSEAKKKKEQLYKKLGEARTIRQRAELINFAINTTKGFSLTAFNDVLTMKGLNAICKILDKYNISHEILPQLIKTEEGVDSLGPLEALSEISSMTNSTNFLHDFQTVIEKNKLASIFSKYELICNELSNKYPTITSKISEFLIKYGDRSFEELKLESLTIKRSPELLLKLLKLHSSTDQREQHSNDFNLKETLSHLNFIDRKLLQFLAYKTQQYIATREACRLIRGEFYGWYRECFLHIFEDLRKDNLLSKYKTEDFFYLHLENIFEYSNGKITTADIVEIIEANKIKYSKVENYPEHIYISKTKQTSYFNKVQMTSESIDDVQSLKGLSASKGNIIGKVLLLKSPLEALDRDDLADCILVTQNTDPAWIYIMTKCKGLISEKGSLLSHTAIIGRELGVPTVVGVKNITQKLIGIDKINLNADNGTITIIN